MIAGQPLRGQERGGGHLQGMQETEEEEQQDEEEARSPVCGIPLPNPAAYLSCYTLRCLHVPALACCQPLSCCQPCPAASQPSVLAVVRTREARQAEPPTEPTGCSSHCPWPWLLPIMVVVMLGGWVGTAVGVAGAPLDVAAPAWYHGRRVAFIGRLGAPGCCAFALERGTGNRAHWARSSLALCAHTCPYPAVLLPAPPLPVRCCSHATPPNPPMHPDHPNLHHPNHLCVRSHRSAATWPAR